jgi:arsenate reductase
MPVGAKDTMTKKKILFLCTQNSARSQMAEGLLRHFYGDRYEAYSAGTHPTEVDQSAIKAMSELGIDIKAHRSKSLDEFMGMQLDMVITVCDDAREACPFFPGAKVHIHKSFQDPATSKGTEKERIAGFRQVRDKILNWIIVNFEK